MIESDIIYAPQKWIWSDTDFDQMGWHDAHIHALAFRPERFQLLLDIDYIFKWVQPVPGEKSYKFWVAPCTLIFKNVRQIRFSIDPIQDISILDITRSDPQEINSVLGFDFLYLLACAEGESVVRSTGYEQFTRRPPSLVSTQRFLEKERGGFSFSSNTPPELTN